MTGCNFLNTRSLYFLLRACYILVPAFWCISPTILQEKLQCLPRSSANPACTPTGQRHQLGFPGIGQRIDGQPGREAAQTQAEPVRVIARGQRTANKRHSRLALALPTQGHLEAGR
jgi:hypothetical protein